MRILKATAIKLSMVTTDVLAVVICLVDALF